MWIDIVLLFLALFLLVLFILVIRLARKLSLITEVLRAAEALKKPEPVEEDPEDASVDEDDDSGDPPEEATETSDAPPETPPDGRPPVVVELLRRGFVVWVDEKPDADVVGLGDLFLETCVPDPTDPESPKFYCPRCAEVMYDFMEAIERPAKKKGRDWRWCEYGSICLACGFIFEDESADFHGFFGPLLEVCQEMQEVFEILDEGKADDQKKLLARREAHAMRQVLRLRSQRKEIEGDAPEGEPPPVAKLERPPPDPDKKPDDPA